MLKTGKDVFRADNNGAVISGWSMDEDSIYNGTKTNTSGAYTGGSGYITIGSTGIRGWKPTAVVPLQAEISRGIRQGQFHSAVPFRCCGKIMRTRKPTKPKNWRRQWLRAKCCSVTRYSSTEPIPSGYITRRKTEWLHMSGLIRHNAQIYTNLLLESNKKTLYSALYKVLFKFAFCF